MHIWIIVFPIRNDQMETGKTETDGEQAMHEHAACVQSLDSDRTLVHTIIIIFVGMIQHVAVVVLTDCLHRRIPAHTHMYTYAPKRFASVPSPTFTYTHSGGDEFGNWNEFQTRARAVHHARECCKRWRRRWEVYTHTYATTTKTQPMSIFFNCDIFLFVFISYFPKRSVAYPSSFRFSSFLALENA